MKNCFHLPSTQVQSHPNATQCALGVSGFNLLQSKIFANYHHQSHRNVAAQKPICTQEGFSRWSIEKLNNYSLLHPAQGLFPTRLLDQLPRHSSWFFVNLPILLQLASILKEAPVHETIHGTKIYQNVPRASVAHKYMTKMPSPLHLRITGKLLYITVALIPHRHVLCLPFASYCRIWTLEAFVRN
jgi:hypothetical protein